MTGSDRAHGTRPARVLARETGRCLAAMALGARRARGVSRLTVPYWMGRRFVGVLGRPLDDDRLLTFRFGTPGGPVRVCVRRNQSDLMVLWELFLHRAYDLAEVYGVELPQRLGTVVDLGANTGLGSAYLTARYRPDLLLAVEPVPQNVAVLRHNARLSGACWRVEESGVGTRPGPAEFFVSGVWDSCTAHPQVAQARRTDPHRLEPVMTRPALTAPILTMPALLDAHGVTQVDLLKVDIEGGEADLFAEVEPWMARVGRIVVEIHDKYIDGDAVRGTLARAGFARLTPRSAAGPVLGSPNRVELFVRR
ncbi:FkbM family methyltransferase [Streptomyces sp. NPDC003832]